MTISRYDTRVMVAALRQIHPPRTMFLDRFFRGRAMSDSQYIDIDIVKGTRRMAPFQSYNDQGRLVEPEGFVTRAYKPSYIKPKMVVKPSHAQTRLAGEELYAGLSAAERERQKVAEYLGSLNDMITRREEWMAARGILDGAVTIVNAETGASDTIDFGMDSDHQIAVGDITAWSEDETCVPIDNIEDWAEVVMQDSGLNVDTIIMGSAAARAFRNSAQVQKFLDNRRFEVGRYAPAQLPEGVSFIGEVKGIDIFAYHAWYQDESGTLHPYMPERHVIVASSQARCTRHYGMIQDEEALVALERFPKSWLEQDPSVRYIQIQSAPLMIPHQIDGFLVAEVIAE